MCVCLCVYIVYAGVNGIQAWKLLALSIYNFCKLIAILNKSSHNKYKASGFSHRSFLRKSQNSSGSIVSNRPTKTFQIHNVTLTKSDYKAIYYFWFKAWNHQYICVFVYVRCSVYHILKMKKKTSLNRWIFHVHFF